MDLHNDCIVELCYGVCLFVRLKISILDVENRLEILR